jgi:hypothetical protein
VLLGITTSVLVSLPLQAATVGYWRFEEAGFLADSSGNGYTLIESGASGAPNPYTLPSSGVGSAFPRIIFGQANAQAVQGSGTSNTFQYRQLSTSINAPSTNLGNEMTVEAFFNQSFSANSSSAVIVGQGVNQTGVGATSSWGLVVTSENSQAGARNLIFQYSTSGGAWNDGNLKTIDTDIQIELNKDYYVAFALDFSDTSSSGVTVYLQNLTDGTPLQTVSLTHTSSDALATTADALTIGTGNIAGNPPFWGVLDEVRLSDIKLSYEDLIIANSIPEPSTSAFIAGFALIFFLVLRKRKLG